MNIIELTHFMVEDPKKTFLNSLTPKISLVILLTVC